MLLFPQFIKYKTFESLWNLDITILIWRTCMVNVVWSVSPSTEYRNGHRLYNFLICVKCNFFIRLRNKHKLTIKTVTKKKQQQCELSHVNNLLNVAHQALTQNLEHL